LGEDLRPAERNAKHRQESADAKRQLYTCGAKARHYDLLVSAIAGAAVGRMPQGR
jgi:hypothetical protein